MEILLLAQPHGNCNTYFFNSFRFFQCDNPFFISRLHVWSVNGDPLATVNTSICCSDRMQQILCVAFSTSREWDQQNVVITGSTDGVVRMWSIEYVQVPIENEKSKGEINPNNENENDKNSTNKSPLDEKTMSTSVDLIKQISLTQDNHCEHAKCT